MKESKELAFIKPPHCFSLEILLKLKDPLLSIILSHEGKRERREGLKNLSVSLFVCFFFFSPQFLGY